MTAEGRMAAGRDAVARRDLRRVRCLLEAIGRTSANQRDLPWTIMEVCGGQTHTLLRSGILDLLPAAVRLVHGPGCPVCVTPVEVLDQAVALAGRPEVTLCSFGDMLRVPGSHGDLLRARAAGGDVRIVYSPLDAVRIAAAEPQRQVVFFAVGFETTAPATALAALEARRLGVRNFSLLVAHVRVPPALEALLAEPDCRIRGFLAAGHVCTVMGTAEYEAVVARHRVPIVVTGFEPEDLLEGILLVVRQLAAGRALLENQYARAVRSAGNAAAQAAMATVYAPCDRAWRGLGVLPASGLGLRPEWHDLDASRRFPPSASAPAESGLCRAGEVLRGRLRPDHCPAFGSACTPDSPLGAPMVSSEGACAAWFRWRRTEVGPCP